MDGSKSPVREEDLDNCVFGPRQIFIGTSVVEIARLCYLARNVWDEFDKVDRRNGLLWGGATIDETFWQKVDEIFVESEKCYLDKFWKLF